MAHQGAFTLWQPSFSIIISTHPVSLPLTHTSTHSGERKLSSCGYGRKEEKETQIVSFLNESYWIIIRFIVYLAFLSNCTLGLPQIWVFGVLEMRSMSIVANSATISLFLKRIWTKLTGIWKFRPCVGSWWFFVIQLICCMLDAFRSTIYWI